MGESEASHAREIRDQTWQINEMHPMNPPDGGYEQIGYQGQQNGHT